MDSSIGNMIGFLIPVLVVVLALGFVLGRRGRDDRDLSGPPSSNFSGPSPSGISGLPSSGEPQDAGRIDLVKTIRSIREMDRATLAQIKAAMDSGNKIEAIKLLRETTGLGLKESKETVEAMFKAAGK